MVTWLMNYCTQNTRNNKNDIYLFMTAMRFKETQAYICIN